MVYKPHIHCALTAGGIDENGRWVPLGSISYTRLAKVVQEYLGHESMATTAIYLHLTKKMKREGATSLEKLMGDL